MVTFNALVHLEFGKGEVVVGRATGLSGVPAIIFTVPEKGKYTVGQIVPKEEYISEGMVFTFPTVEQRDAVFNALRNSTVTL